MKVQQFIDELTAQLEPLSKDASEASWMAQTTGEKEWSEKAGERMAAIKLLLSDKEKYEQVKQFLQQDGLTDLERRQLIIIKKSMAENQLPKEALVEMAKMSSELNHLFNTYTPEVNGKKLLSNDIRNVLKDSDDLAEREQVWKASKEVGQVVEEKLLQLVKKRNEAARELGYKNYHEMSFANQELERDEIFAMFESLVKQTDDTFKRIKGELDAALAQKFKISVDDIRPWHYVDPFFQDAPALEEANLDPFFKDKDLEQLTADTFAAMDMPIDDLYEKSDLYPRQGKNPTAFCMDMDRQGDIRVLCNNVPNTYWMGVMLHEFGHAAYNKYIDQSLPYVTRSYAHILTTESIAMLYGKMTENAEWLERFLKLEPSVIAEKKDTLEKYEQLKLLISARWIITFVFFERELYENPDQDLNALWWEKVEKIQLLTPPDDRSNPDWAAKIHFTLAPVYYQNYLLGELTAAQLYQYVKTNVSEEFFTSKVGTFIRDEFLKPGARYHWNDKIERVTGERLNPKFFVEKYCD